MVRTATRADVATIITMLKHYRDAGAELQEHNHNRAHVERLVEHIIVGAGCAFIAENQGQPTGLLLAIKTANLWNPNQWFLQELAYWVEPTARSGRTGYRLLQAYCDYGDRLKDQGSIEYYTISQTPKTQLKYNRVGFHLAHETWIQ